MTKEIEKESWEAIKEVTGKTKEDFEFEIENEKVMEDDIRDFIKDINSWFHTVRQMPEGGEMNFSPSLFLLWKIWKENGGVR